MNANRLSNVASFGGIDADADELLKACFQEHPSYLAVLEHRRFLVLGRKGAGKTAIFKKLITQNSEASISYGHTFDDYPWHHHDLQAQTGVPEERRYVHSWKYLILMSLAKIILNSDYTQPWSDESMHAMSILEDFVVDSYGSRDPDLTQLFSPSKELKFKSTLDFKVWKTEGERIKVDHLPARIQDVNRTVQNAVLAVMNPDVSYFSCFDQLDLGLSLTDDAYGHRVVGLIVAARDLFVAAREAGKSFTPAVFLRDDIYQDLQFEDKNKITENYASTIAWSASEGTLTLKSLMERRFTEVLGSGDAVHWDEVFDESNEMPSRQNKYRHICDRTLLRPRDIIKFCNQALLEHQRSGQASECIGNSSVHAARDEYSNYLLNELDDEIAKHVPEYKLYLEVLKAIGAEKFEYEDFVKVFELRDELNDYIPKEALGKLFEFSVISYLKPGGRGGGSGYVWRYQDPRARFDSTVPSYRVHPGFKEALDLSR